MEEGKGHLNVLVFFFFKTWQTCSFREKSSKSGGDIGEGGDDQQHFLSTYWVSGPFPFHFLPVTPKGKCFY